MNTENNGPNVNIIVSNCKTKKTAIIEIKNPIDGQPAIVTSNMLIKAFSMLLGTRLMPTYIPDSGFLIELAEEDIETIVIELNFMLNHLMVPWDIINILMEEEFHFSKMIETLRTLLTD